MIVDTAYVLMYEWSEFRFGKLAMLAPLVLCLFVRIVPGHYIIKNSLLGDQPTSMYIPPFRHPICNNINKW